MKNWYLKMMSFLSLFGFFKKAPEPVKATFLKCQCGKNSGPLRIVEGLYYCPECIPENRRLFCTLPRAQRRKGDRLLRKASKYSNIEAAKRLIYEGKQVVANA